MKQVQCPSCKSYKTSSNRFILRLMGVFFIFPGSIIGVLLLGVIGLALVVVTGIAFIVASFLPVAKGYMCMSCRYKWK